MKYVLDSSFAFNWLVPELNTDKALRLLDDYQRSIHDLLSPDILPVEVTHALTRAERQGLVTPAQGSHLFLDLMDQVPTPFLPLRVAAGLRNLVRAARRCLRLRLRCSRGANRLRTRHGRRSAR